MDYLDEGEHKRLAVELGPVRFALVGTFAEARLLG